MTGFFAFWSYKLSLTNVLLPTNFLQHFMARNLEDKEGNSTKISLELFEPLGIFLPMQAFSYGDIYIFKVKFCVK